ncbi:LysM peptidoglycan-binding domain-containing protein [Methylobacterium marchantiae]|uniref:LysM peptidoglycan-binding domain-containing protein n=1 Tax=Methylobacterium marchantiae TaxID=600331 RepID=UPI001EDD5DAC
MAALSQADVDIGRGKSSEAVSSGGSMKKSEPEGQGVATAPGAPETNAPTFDTVRVEPNGELVVAGRATPNGTVEVLVDGKPTARAVADANGQFAIVPPALPAGNSEVGLRVTDGKGMVRQSRDIVAVAVPASHNARPLVALTSPDKPTVVLSQPRSSRTVTRSVPDASSPLRTTTGTASPIHPGTGEVAPSDGASNAIAANDAARSIRIGNRDNLDAGVADRAVPNTLRSGSLDMPLSPPLEGAAAGGAGEASTRIVSVDAQEGGRLFVSGQATAGTTVRLYLNDTLIAPARVGRDGTVTFTIGGGVKPGSYTVRLDQVDAASGKVRSRVEVPFSVPEAARIARTDRPVAAPLEAAPKKNGGEKAASNASQPIASSPETVSGHAQAANASDGPQDSISTRPATPASSEAGSDPLRLEANPAAVFVPEVETARIERGDSLWAISRRIYGEGDRYTAIYDANQDQIRDPDLIYPGQVFVLPSGHAAEAGWNDKRN